MDALRVFICYGACVALSAYTSRFKGPLTAMSITKPTTTAKTWYNTKGKLAFQPSPHAYTSV